MPEDSPAGPSDFLAAERTLLAWQRTGLALMGFGFVVARFGLFVQELGLGAPNLATRHSGLSLAFGTGLIALGVVVDASSGWNYVRVVRTLRRGERAFTPSVSPGIGLAVVLSLLGAAMAIGLLSVSRTSAGAQPTTETTAMSKDNGIVTVAARGTVDQTVDTLRHMLEAKGVKLFALIDHSGEAMAAGFQMRPTKLLIFGSPKAGTPLMLAAPSIAIDLPLKLLVWEDPAGKAWISYNAPAYLQARHDLPQALAQALGAPAAFAAQVGK
jgi:uncharacterized protein (DUF302 family)/uncharacterized membrane protein YidH (DUF202 family)